MNDFEARWWHGHLSQTGIVSSLSFPFSLIKFCKLEAYAGKGQALITERNFLQDRLLANFPWPQTPPLQETNTAWSQSIENCPLTQQSETIPGNSQKTVRMLLKWLSCAFFCLHSLFVPHETLWERLCLDKKSDLVFPCGRVFFLPS